MKRLAKDTQPEDVLLLVICLPISSSIPLSISKPVGLWNALATLT